MIKPIFDIEAAKLKTDEIVWDFDYKIAEQLAATHAMLDRLADRTKTPANHVNEKRGFEFLR